MLSLLLNTPPQAQLEVPPALLVPCLLLPTCLLARTPRPVWSRALQPLWSACLLLKPSLAFFSLFPLPEPDAFDLSSSPAQVFPSVDSCSGSSSQLLFFPPALPLKCGTSRCWIRSISEQCCNLSVLSALVKISTTFRLVQIYQSSSSPFRTHSTTK